MTLIEAQQKTSQILDEERTSPTTHYMSPEPFVNQAAIAANPLRQGGRHPRPVSEKRDYYHLQSLNYDLLKAFFEEISSKDRPLYLATLRQRLSGSSPFKTTRTDVLGVGKTTRTNSDLPLIAEFLVRHGDGRTFLTALPNVALRPALTRLLRHIEETTALDYRLFPTKLRRACALCREYKIEVGGTKKAATDLGYSGIELSVPRL